MDYSFFKSLNHFNIRLLKIKNSDLSEIIIKEDSENTIFYPYRIKEIEGDISREEKVKIFYKELTQQLREKNLLGKNDMLSLGYINRVLNDRIYYLFYNVNLSQDMKLAKYGNYFINNRPNFWLMFADYYEKSLSPAYSRWNPKKDYNLKGFTTKP